MIRCREAQRLPKNDRQQSASSANQRNQNANNSNIVASRNQSRAHPSNSRSRDAKRKSPPQTKTAKPFLLPGRDRTILGSTRASFQSDNSPPNTFTQNTVRAIKEREFQIAHEAGSRRLVTIKGIERASKGRTRVLKEETKIPVNRNTTRDKEKAGFRRFDPAEFSVTLNYERISTNNGVEHHRYFRETYRVPFKPKAATAEKLTTKISFSSRRKTCDFTVYNKEDSRMLIPKSRNLLVQSSEDNDCDTDDDQIREAKAMCLQQFQHALKEAIKEQEDKRGHKMSSTNRSTSALSNVSTRNRIFKY